MKLFLYKKSLKFHGLGLPHDLSPGGQKQHGAWSANFEQKRKFQTYFFFLEIVIFFKHLFSNHNFRSNLNKEIVFFTGFSISKDILSKNAPLSLYLYNFLTKFNVILTNPNYTICLHTKSKQQHEAFFHISLFCLHLVPVMFSRV
jgi:hypothetical protein